MLATLLLEGVYLAREIESIGMVLAVLGLLLASWMAYKGWKLLRQAERWPDGTLRWGMTLERWTGGVLLMLPGVLLVLLPVVNFFEARREQRAYERVMLARQRLFTAEYELDSLASPPGMRRYRFDLSLRPDSTFELRTNVPQDRPYSTGRWRVEIRSTDTVSYNLRLEATQGNVIQLYTLDQQAGSWLERSSWPVGESVCLRKRRPAER